MKSIERRFANLEQSRPMAGSYMNFASAVMNGHFTHDIIRRWFNRLVDKEDYCRKDKRAILAFLYALSNPPRTTGIEDEFALRASPISVCVVQSV